MAELAALKNDSLLQIDNHVKDNSRVNCCSTRAAMSFEATADMNLPGLMEAANHRNKRNTIPFLHCK